MSALERIMQVTGRTPTECRCPVCRSYCQTPCLGTPEDIRRLLDAGYAPHLTPTYWCVGMLFGVMKHPVLMVQLIRGSKGCVLLQDGLCKLHELGLKPMEGRLSHHIITEENLSFHKSLSWNVAKKWLRPENEQDIRGIFDSLEQYRAQSETRDNSV